MDFCYAKRLAGFPAKETYIPESKLNVKENWGANYRGHTLRNARLRFRRKTGKIHPHAPRTKLPQVRTPHVALSLLAQQLPHRTPPLRRLRIRRHSPAHSVQTDER